MTQALTARSFLTLYSLVAQNAQDQSTQGIANAKQGINNIIYELTKEFKLPEVFKGRALEINVPVVAGNGQQAVTINADVVRVKNVWYIQNGLYYPLSEITSDQDWIRETDNYTNGDPSVYRQFVPDSFGNNTIQFWPGPSTGWVSQSGGLLYYSYDAMLSALVNDSDIPALPYGLDTILVNGGTLEVARMQGDSVLLGIYSAKYESDKGELRAWITKQHNIDPQMSPSDPMGMFGINIRSDRYRPQ